MGECERLESWDDKVYPVTVGSESGVVYWGNCESSSSLRYLKGRRAVSCRRYVLWYELSYLIGFESVVAPRRC